MPSVKDYIRAAASFAVGLGVAGVVWLFARLYGPYIGWESGYRFDSPSSPSSKEGPCE